MDSIAGNGAADSAINAQSEFAKPAYEYLMGSCIAGIWDTDGLEKRYRSLTVISCVPPLAVVKQSGKAKEIEFWLPRVISPNLNHMLEWV